MGLGKRIGGWLSHPVEKKNMKQIYIETFPTSKTGISLP